MLLTEVPDSVPCSVDDLPAEHDSEVHARHLVFLTVEQQRVDEGVDQLFPVRVKVHHAPGGARQEQEERDGAQEARSHGENQ